MLEHYMHPPRIGSYKSVRTTELSFLNSFLPQQWKIFLRQSNEKIRLLLVCLSSHNNLSLPLSFYFFVAGAALMDISEAHKRVHLELDDTVSAEHGGRVKVWTLVYMRPAKCHSTIALQLHRRPSKTIALYVCVLDSLPFFTKSTSLLILKMLPFLVLTFIQVKQRSRNLCKEGKGTGLDCRSTCCPVAFLENSRQALTCPGKTA